MRTMDINIKPLKDNGWEFELPHHSAFGYWLDPVTQQYYKTEKALEMQLKRESKGLKKC